MGERKQRTSERNQRFARGNRKPAARAKAPQAFDPDAPLWLYGHHAVGAALANPDRVIHRLVATPNAARQIDGAAEAEIMTPRDIDKLLPEGAVHQGIAIFTEQLTQPSIETVLEEAGTRPLVFLDQVTDPHNVGAILRSASAFGAGAVITTRRNAASVTGVLAKSASGALDHIPYLQRRNLADTMGAAREAGYYLVGLDEEGDALIGDVVDRSARIGLVLGAEGPGLRAKTKETCDALVRLPTEGPVAALNVSNAAAVSLYAVTQGRTS